MSALIFGSLILLSIPSQYILGKQLMISEAIGIFSSGLIQGMPMKIPGRVKAATLDPITIAFCQSVADLSRILYTPLTRVIALCDTSVCRHHTDCSHMLFERTRKEVESCAVKSAMDY